MPAVAKAASQQAAAPSDARCAAVITPLPGATPTKAGAATFPFFGVEPALLDFHGNEIQGVGEG